MKWGWAFLLSGLFLVLVGIGWILAGSSMTPVLNPGNPFAPATPATEQPTVTPAVSHTVITPTAVPVTETPAGITADEARLHFLDLAFGAGNAVLERWSPTENNGRIVVSVTANKAGDTALLVDAARQFNGLSQTNRISENIKEASSSDITIKFIPDSGMDGIVLNTSGSLISREFRENGVTTAKVTPGVVYINGSLNGDLRNHTLIRSLYYELGFVGDTQTYPDSLFFTGNNRSVSLSTADQKAVEIMYGPGLTRGMSAADVKRVIYPRS